MKSVTSTHIWDHLDSFFNMKALDNIQNSNLPVILQPTSIIGSQSTTSSKSDASSTDTPYAEFQLPLKGFYRHFKEMTETSKSNLEFINFNAILQVSN